MHSLKNILYYPSINLPKSNWVTQSILYWDEVGVIVPYEFVDNPEFLEPEMRNFVLSGAIRQYPTSHYGLQELEASRGVFQLLLDNQNKLEQLRSSFEGGYTWKIHQEKFDDELFENLVGWKIAKKINNSYWYLIEESVARIMMTLLATLIARETNSLTSTDDESFIQENNFWSFSNDEPSELRSVILNDVMPCPEDYNLDDLIRFKDKYKNELDDFRRLVEQKILILRTISDKELQSQLIQVEISEILDRRDELIVRLNESKFKKIVLGTIKGAIVDAVIATATGGVISPAASVLSGINETIKQYKQKPLRDEDLAYIALLKNKYR